MSDDKAGSGSKAYVKIWVYPGKEREAVQSLRKLKCVMSAELTAGEQDVIALVNGKSYEDILQIVVKQMRTLKSVRNTVSNLILD